MTTPTPRRELDVGAAVAPAHTPGPWVARRHDAHEWHIDVTEMRFASVAGRFGRWDAAIVCYGIEGAPAAPHVAEANARLIAAAPDLLAALKNLLAVKNGEGGTLYHSDEIARAAIAKAEGR